MAADDELVELGKDRGRAVGALKVSVGAHWY